MITLFGMLDDSEGTLAGAGTGAVEAVVATGIGAAYQAGRKFGGFADWVCSG